jgi:hypothetical protein
VDYLNVDTETAFQKPCDEISVSREADESFLVHPSELTQFSAEVLVSRVVV